MVKSKPIFKATAKRSTGAPAPRMNANPSGSSVKVLRKRAKMAPTNQRMGGGGSNIAGNSITNTINLNIHPEVATHVLTVDVRGPANEKADMEKEHDNVRAFFFHISTG